MVNRIWPTAVAGKADSVSSVSASSCHIGGPNSVNPGQILLVYGNNRFIWKIFTKMFHKKPYFCCDIIFVKMFQINQPVVTFGSGEYLVLTLSESFII